MSIYLDFGTLLPELSIFIFQGFQKLSEGEETMGTGEHKRWKRSTLKLKSVLISHRLCFSTQKYMCALHIYTFILAASFSEGFLAQNKKNFSNALQSNPAALAMNVGQRWLCSQPGAIFLHVSFVVILMTPTWQRGSQLDQLTTVFTGMGVQERSKYFQICIIIYSGRHFSFDFSIASDTRNFHALSFVEVDSELSFCIFHKFLITESQKGGAE